MSGRPCRRTVLRMAALSLAGGGRARAATGPAHVGFVSDATDRWGSHLGCDRPLRRSCWRK